MIELTAASGQLPPDGSVPGPVHSIEENAMTRQSKTLQRRKAHALGHRSGARRALGPVLPALALQTVQGGADHANLYPPVPSTDPPPIYRG
jgi:hypothetical protein